MLWQFSQQKIVEFPQIFLVAHQHFKPQFDFYQVIAHFGTPFSPAIMYFIEKYIDFLDITISEELYHRIIESIKSLKVIEFPLLYMLVDRFREDEQKMAELEEFVVQGLVVIKEKYIIYQSAFKMEFPELSLKWQRHMPFSVCVMTNSNVKIFENLKLEYRFVLYDGNNMGIEIPQYNMICTSFYPQGYFHQRKIDLVSRLLYKNKKVVNFISNNDVNLLMTKQFLRIIHQEQIVDEREFLRLKEELEQSIVAEHEKLDEIRNSFHQLFQVKER